ncbi:unnamed protein product [Rhizophagus irregularis]|nr:unnamed protein product [Rhizophagus irregularis]
MDLRTHKSGLNQRQQLQDTSFRLRKPKKMKQKEKQLVSLSVQNISHDTFAHNNNNNVPLRSDISDIEAPIYPPTDDSFYINQEHQDGKAGPYFPNYTHFLLFMWVTKYQIGCEAFRELSNIVKHPDFNPNDVPLSLSTIKQHRNGLPLITFNGYNVNICDYNTPSTSKSFRQAFIFPLKSILFRILSNEQLRKQMYFGPGIYSDDKRELWHRDIWHNHHYLLNIILENLLSGMVQTPILKHLSLKSRQRKNQSHIGMLWMTDKSIIIEPTIIESKIRVWLTDINQPDRYEYFIEEIVYIANGFIPFAATCDDVLKPLVSDIKELESGFEMDLGDECIWIMGGLGDITSDLPEGNEQAGVKNHNANYGCRNCTIHRNELHDMSFDILANGQYHHNTTLQINELNNTRTQGECDSLSTQYGIRNKPSILTM